VVDKEQQQVLHGTSTISQKVEVERPSTCLHLVGPRKLSA
jgi:hypothetical protein